MNDKLPSVLKTIYDVQNNNYLKEKNQYLRKDISKTNNQLLYFIKNSTFDRQKRMDMYTTIQVSRNGNYDFSLEGPGIYRVRTPEKCECDIIYCNNILEYSEIDTYNIVNKNDYTLNESEIISNERQFSTHNLRRKRPDLNVRQIRQERERMLVEHRENDILNWKTICNECFIKLIKNEINIKDIEEFTETEWNLLKDMEPYSSDKCSYIDYTCELMKIKDSDNLDKKLRFEENNKLKMLLTNVLEDKLPDNKILLELFKTIDFYNANRVS